MKSAFDLKSARLEAFTLRLFTADLVVIAALLEEKAAQYAKFANMPFILDATRLQLQRADELDLAAVVALFAARDLRVVALQHGKKDWSELANKAGLLWLDGGKKANRQPENDADDVSNQDIANNQHDADSNNDEAQSADNAVNQQTQPENAETVENNIEQPAEASAQEDNPTESTTDKPQPETLLTTRKTVVVTSPVRTGQQVYAEQADLIVLGMVSEGAEIIADGNIHVYAANRATPARAFSCNPCRQNWCLSRGFIGCLSRICRRLCTKRRCKLNCKTMSVWRFLPSTPISIQSNKAA